MMYVRKCPSPSSPTSTPRTTPTACGAGRGYPIGPLRCDKCDPVRCDKCDLIRCDKCDLIRCDECDPLRCDECDPIRCQWENSAPMSKNGVLYDDWISYVNHHLDDLDSCGYHLPICVDRHPLFPHHCSGVAGSLLPRDPTASLDLQAPRDGPAHVCIRHQSGLSP